MRVQFPFYLKIIAKNYGRTICLQQLRNLSETLRTGSSLLGLSDVAESIGLKSLVKIGLEK
ncbi:cysteine peptidase family C39 domain-containing protein [Tenacibaculum sp. C7A-26P2]|uniref:cysteine peptidase family C39 domain-containing protein n=1 Tax=Tenacibaculum sp. C7A-26P2 TaxID=3447504 RepID=UPI003F87140C